MKLSSLVVSVVLSFACLAALGEAAEIPEMQVPIFGIEYTPSVAHFDPATPDITSNCSALKGRKLWIFASYRDSRAQYYIVSGYVPSPVKGEVMPDPLGTVVALRGSKCVTYIGTAWVFSGRLDAAHRKNLPATFDEDIPGLDADPYCDDSGMCHYFIRSFQAEAVLNGLLNDEMARCAKAFHGKPIFLRKLHKVHRSFEEFDPIITARLKDYAK